MSETRPGPGAEGFTFVEPLIGWRAWGLQRRPAGLTLVPAAYGRGDWPARDVFVATCRARSIHPSHPPKDEAHRSPEPYCSCGVYASDTLRSLVTSAGRMPPLPVVGTVALWGRVIEHVRGWRAEFAYPDRIRLVCGACLSMGEGSGVPIIVVESYARSQHDGAFTPFCSEHAVDVPVGTQNVRDARSVQTDLLSRYAVDLMSATSVASLFEGAVVAGPVSSRPQRSRPLAAPTPPAHATSQGPASAPAPTPGPAARWRERLRDTAGTALGIAFWVVVGWWGCTSMVVEVPAAPLPRPTRPAPSRIAPEARPVHPGTGMARHRPEPETDWAFVCGIPHGRWVELATCRRPAADLWGFAETPPGDGPCIPPRTAVTRTERYSICWSTFTDVDVIRHPRAPNPFASEVH